MKHGKVAICLSGQVRTGIEAFPSFQNFFSHLNADIFFHTWTTENNKLDTIFNLYKPTEYLVNDPKDPQEMGSFGSMLYSIMMANELKKRHEIDNNFRYDLVIKTRFDLVFLPGNLFPLYTLIPRTIYCSGGNVGINHVDFERHGINDIIFWGDSAAMDIATNAFFTYKYHCLPNHHKLMSGLNEDPRDTYFSAGTLIYNNIIKYNIATHRFVPYINEIPWREDVKHLHPVKDFELIRKRYEQL